MPGGAELGRACRRLATARVLQETLEQEQTEALGRGRYERQATPHGERHGYEEGTGQTAAGIRRLPRPQVRGRRQPSRSTLWAALGRPRAVRPPLSGERAAGGLSQRDLESALEKALGQCGLSQRAGRDSTDRLTPEDEAGRTRDRSGDDLAYLFLEAV